jgi:FixJ family two-component response regulator
MFAMIASLWGNKWELRSPYEQGPAREAAVPFALRQAGRTREMTKLIAIIDDDDAMQDALRDLMEAAGVVAQCFGSAEAFLESDLHTRAACLIVDIRMPKMSGLQLQARLKQEACDIPIIFITAYDDAAMRIQAMREGAVEFLAKPLDHQLMLKTVRAALDM